jgi:hypothetical protein
MPMARTLALANPAATLGHHTWGLSAWGSAFEEHGREWNEPYGTSTRTW